VVGSNTAPVKEVIRHEETGLLADFDDVESLSQLALRALAKPAPYRALGVRGRALVTERYGLETTFPKLWELFIRVRR
jgi:glycosyltransferase involved in cell wall biosynthesis